MAGDINWILSWDRLTEKAVREAAVRLVAVSEGVSFEVEDEGDGCVSLFLKVADPEDPYTVELSFYDLEEGGIVMSLEEEWSDNAEAWDAACGLAEGMAELLDAQELDDD